MMGVRLPAAGETTDRNSIWEGGGPFWSPWALHPHTRTHMHIDKALLSGYVLAKMSRRYPTKSSNVFSETGACVIVFL